MRLHDVFYNWLQIKHVAESRPQDKSAQKTYELFGQILRDDHKITSIEVREDDVCYYIDYRVEDGPVQTQRCIRTFVDRMLEDIEEDPKWSDNFD